MILSDFTEPQPDLAVLRWRADDYMADTPRAGDTLLVIEVADSSPRFDRDVKLRFYALASVPEVWIVDVGARRLLRFTQPEGDGYRSETFGAGATVRCAGLTGLVAGIDELFA